MSLTLLKSEKSKRKGKDEACPKSVIGWSPKSVMWGIHIKIMILYASGCLVTKQCDNFYIEVCKALCIVPYMNRIV